MNDLKDLLGARLFLLDMDGTLYLGDDVFPGAVDFIHTLAETGRQYIYLTNNSSRAGTDYITRLRRLGFPCEAENVFTSGMATALYLNQHYAGKPVYLVGHAGVPPRAAQLRHPARGRGRGDRRGRI